MGHGRPAAMTEPEGRSRLGRSLRMLAAGGFALSALLAFGAWGAVARHQAPAPRPAHSSASVAVTVKTAVAGHRTARPRSRTIHVAPGATLKRFDVSEPAGAIRLLSVTVPYGTRARLTGTIPGVASIAVSTPRSTVPSETCQRRGTADVCTQAEEPCPMPAATWHFRLVKFAGPAGEVRIQFVVG